MKRCVVFLVLFGTLAPFMAICQYTGGSNDGFTYLPLLKTAITDANAFKGGANGGFVATFLSKTDFTDVAAFKGSGGDGFQSVFLGKANITDGNAFKGGSGRGEAQGNLGNCDGEIVVWNGSQSSDWDNMANWNCGKLPQKGSTVIISSGAPNHPKVNINFEIHKLILEKKAGISVQPGIKFNINGQ
jgi:hypothetical protein